MPTIIFASALARWRSAEPSESTGEWAIAADGTTMREVFDAVFKKFPTLRSYVLDERGALRHHVVVFVDSEPLRDKQLLGDTVKPDSEIHVFQALSGG